MKNYRVTIKHKAGKQTNLISTVVPSKDVWEAIGKVQSANNIAEENIISRKAELLKTN
jgi:hypothetical protein